MTIADFHLTEKDEHPASATVGHWLDVHSAAVALFGCAFFWSLVAASLYYIL